MSRFGINEKNDAGTRFGLNRVRMKAESSYFRAGEIEDPSTGLQCDLQLVSYPGGR